MNGAAAAAPATTTVRPGGRVANPLFLFFFVHSLCVSSMHLVKGQKEEEEGGKEK